MRIEHPLPEEERRCLDCAEERERIGEDAREVLHFRPARYEVNVHVRGRYACRRLPDNGVRQPPGPLPRPIPGSYAGASQLPHVLLSKYGDHLPLYRQAEIFRPETGLPLALPGRTHPHRDRQQRAAVPRVGRHRELPDP